MERNHFNYYVIGSKHFVNIVVCMTLVLFVTHQQIEIKYEYVFILIIYKLQTCFNGRKKLSYSAGTE